MVRNPVSSSNLYSVGYDSVTRTLEVEFHSGRVYQYFGVPNSIYVGLMNAGSHGQYFNAHIRNVFPYLRIR
jgi:hypothetical protein